uniref:Putative signal transduction n=1 Tax=Lutzomyia longipalpis TaxID=7200 RepID=A0A1B0GIA7_LUTLO
MAQCEIKFDRNPYGVYLAGQTISGQVELNIFKIKKVRAVTLRIVGYAKCRWTESDSHGTRGQTRTTVYHGREDYLASLTDLVGRSQDGSTIELAPGMHSYRFTCDLPHQLPTSFEGSKGYIRYYVIVALERPWKFDQKFKVAFTVLKQFDLNFESPVLRLPCQVSMERSFCCGPCKTGPISIIAHTSQSGYVPGQMISVHAEIANASTVKVEEIRFSLKKLIRYTSQTPRTKTKEETLTISEGRISGMKKKQSGKFEQHLQIPPLPPTSVSLCRIITISYEVKIEAKVSGAHLNPVVKIPITLGTVPLRDNVYNVVPGTQGIQPPIQMEPILNPISHPSSDQNLPPPSYEECIFGTVQVKDDEDDEKTVMSCTKYAPRYPVYNCNNWPKTGVQDENKPIGFIINPADVPPNHNHSVQAAVPQLQPHDYPKEMGLKGCQIVLDNPWNTYYAGQTINGKVEFTFDSPKKVRGILIRFLGEANTSWEEREKRQDSEGKETEEITHLSGHEEYFQIQYYLLGGKNSGEIELNAGTHTYPFTCALPPTLPSSFEGEWGHVRYTVKVTLDRPWKFDQDSKMAFTVISPVDLNLNPRVKEQFKLDLEKSFCCLCCRSGPLSAIVIVPVTGYVSGQVIPITAECDNASNVRVTGIKIHMRKIISFHTHQPRRETKKDKVNISEVSGGAVEPGGSNTWTFKLEIPPLPPSNLVNCGIIDVDYDLKIVVEVAGAHRNLEGKIPITLGTVPLADFKPPAPYSDEPPQDPSMLPTQPVSPASPPETGGALGWSITDSGGHQLYPNIPPPTFAESSYKSPSIANKEDTQYTRFMGDNFAPRYPTYAFNPTAPPTANY